MTPADEERYRHQLRLFEAVTATTPDFIYVFDLQGRFVFANRRLLEVWGKTYEQAIGKNLYELGYPQWHADMHMRELQQVIETKRPIKGVVPFTGGSGIFGIYEYIFTPVLGPDGRVEVIAGTTRDVTERQQAATEREQIAAHLRLALNAARMGWWHYDPATKIATYDERFGEIFGIPGGERPNAEILRLIHPEDLPKVWAAVEAALDPVDPRPYSTQYRIRRPDGAGRYIEAHGLASFEGSGESRRATRFVGTVADVTERKRAEIRDRFLVALDDAVRALTDPARITAACARLLGEHLGVDRCAYADVEADQDTFNLTGDYTRPGVASIVGRYRFADFGQEVLRLMRADRPYVVEDVDAHEPPVGDVSAYRATGIRAVICVPLHKDGRFTAALAVHQAVPRRWTAAEVDLVRHVAGRCWESIERARVERTLRASEARFRLLADSMPQMVWVTRPDGYHEYYNRRWYEFTGMPEGSTDGEGWAALFHPDDQPRAWERWRHCLATGEPYEIEYRLRHHTGEYRWTLGRALPVRNAAGAIERWYGTCTDIHDQKRIEADLRHSREQLELVVHGANVGVWYCPLPFDRLIWDATVKSHFHLPPDAEVTIETFYDRLHPDDRERTRRAIERSIESRQPYEIDYRTVCPDGGRVKWVHASGRGFYDSAGDPVRFDGITMDVTDRVRAEERVREESQVVDTINRVGRTIAAELDLGRLVQVVTDATTELTGAQFGAFFYNVVNERGESYSLYTLSGVDRSHFEKFPMPRNTAVFGPTFNGEGIVRLDDVKADPRYGRSAPYHGQPPGHLPVRSYLAVPVVSRSGEVLGGLFFGHAKVGVFTERSERVVAGIAAQAAVAIDNARLFEAARRANAEKDKLLESERAARGEAERASRMKDEFLATLSHELRTPLNAILGWAQILQNSPDEDDLRQGIEIIERNARAQTQIIEDLLDMSRIVSGKIRLEVQRLDLAGVVRGAVETVRPAADAKGIRLQTVLDPHAGPVSGDPNRLQQVFWNLLTNAVKFTPKGGRIQVVLERVNSHLEVSVSDTGEGIAPEFLPHVFDRFRQQDASTTRRHGGLGLGLAIVKQLTELHGGSVRVKSGGVGLGSTFTVGLPLMVLHPEPEPGLDRRHPSAGAVAGGLDRCPQIEGVKVLVVDDEPDARLLVQRLLEDCKAVVTTAASAAEGLDRLRTERPDVLVSDIGMPGEDGYSLIRKVRALGAAGGGNVPAIALTAYARAEDRMKAMLAGFEQHVVKPVEPAELITVIAILAGRAGR